MNTNKTINPHKLWLLWFWTCKMIYCLYQYWPINIEFNIDQSILNSILTKMASTNLLVGSPIGVVVEGQIDLLGLPVLKNFQKLINFWECTFLKSANLLFFYRSRCLCMFKRPLYLNVCLLILWSWGSEASATLGWGSDVKKVGTYTEALLAGLTACNRWWLTLGSRVGSFRGWG